MTPLQTLHSVGLSVHGRSASTPKDLKATDIAVCAFALDSIPTSSRAQHARLQQLQHAGANAVELRRTSLPAGFRGFEELGHACKAHNQHIIYNTEDTLWDSGYISASLTSRLAEATALGASAIKFSLGYYPGIKAACWPQMIASLRGSMVDLVMIENDKSLVGGSLRPLTTCLEDAETLGYPLRMAFDSANWRWCGVNQMLAAKRLGRFVRQIDCRDVRQSNGRFYSSPPTSLEQRQWRALLDEFEQASIFTLEYPLAAACTEQTDNAGSINTMAEQATQHARPERAPPLPIEAGFA